MCSIQLEVNFGQLFGKKVDFFLPFNEVLYIFSKLLFINLNLIIIIFIEQPVNHSEEDLERRDSSRGYFC